MGAVAAVAAVDADAAAAVADGDGAVLAAEDSGGVLAGGVDVARYVEVLDDAAALCVAEGGDVGVGGDVAGLAVVEGEGVLLAVEGAHEVVVLAARHTADLDVRAQLDGHAAEAVPRVVVFKAVAELVPALCRADDVGMVGAAVHQRVVVVAEEGEVVPRDTDGDVITDDGERCAADRSTAYDVALEHVALAAGVAYGERGIRKVIVHAADGRLRAAGVGGGHVVAAGHAVIDGVVVGEIGMSR